MAKELPGNLTGTYLVRAGSWAFQEARKWLPRTRDRVELRRHALKLRFWPTGAAESEAGQVEDLDWSWIRSLSGKRIGELRIHDEIGNCDNLRVIFFVPRIVTELPIVWILSVFQKKRDEFTVAQIRNYDLRCKLILERFYHNPLDP
jgi:hypothetical protein